MIKKKLIITALFLIGGVFGAGVLMSSTVFASSSIAITSCQDLAKIGVDSDFPLSGSYVLTQNIDCYADTHSGGALYNSGEGFTPIAKDFSFSGNIDGQNHTISGLYINSVDNGVGLISDATDATVSNLNLRDSVINGTRETGAIIGRGAGNTVENVSTNAHVTATDGYTGGIMGSSDDGTAHLTNDRFTGSVDATTYAVGGLIGDSDGDVVITDSFSTGDVTVGGSEESYYVGGLLGDTDGNITITRSFATGNVTVSSDFSDSVGGLVGWSAGDTITDSFATGDVSAPSGQNVGGLIGYIGTGTITNAYSSGAVSGDSTLGGFIGSQESVVISNSFYGLDSSGQNAACGNIGGCDPAGVDDLTSAEMINPDVFTGAGWDYDSTWHQTSDQNSGYPYLIWPVDQTKNNPVTEKNAELVVPFGCSINNMSVAAESTNSVQDAGYSYPQGLMNFSVECATNGFMINVTQYFLGVTSGQSFIARKYNPTTKTYTTIPGATISYVTVNGQSAAKVVYSAKDGGSLDADGSANGVLEDPSGLSLVSPGAPDTGHGQPASTNKLPALLVLGGLVSLAISARTYSNRKTR